MHNCQTPSQPNLKGELLQGSTVQDTKMLMPVGKFNQNAEYSPRINSSDQGKLRPAGGRQIKEKLSPAIIHCVVAGQIPLSHLPLQFINFQQLPGCSPPGIFCPSLRKSLIALGSLPACCYSLPAFLTYQSRAAPWLKMPKLSWGRRSLPLHN